jgi:hypothetical protein
VGKSWPGLASADYYGIERLRHVAHLLLAFALGSETSWIEMLHAHAVEQAGRRRSVRSSKAEVEEGAGA